MRLIILVCRRHSMPDNHLALELLLGVSVSSTLCPCAWCTHCMIVHPYLSSMRMLLPHAMPACCVSAAVTSTCVAAVQIAGGPKIPMRYGRVDAATAEECQKEGNLPGETVQQGKNRAGRA